LDPRVFEAMKPYFITVYGNASSIHSLGAEARQAVEASRETVAELMNAEPNEFIFTGSATEANNMTLKKAISLVYVIHGNNEIGTIQQIKQIGKLCYDYGAYFHTDAAQSFGKIPIDVNDMNIDFMTVNAHKLYGPKGVGALYIKKGIKIDPLLHGGGHEFGLRSSTENVAGIAGFANAVELRKQEMEPEAQRLTQMRDRLIKGVLEIDETYLNGHPHAEAAQQRQFQIQLHRRRISHSPPQRRRHSRIKRIGLLIRRGNTKPRTISHRT
jgi:cysteine desulfurase